MYRPARERARPDRRNRTVEIVCVVFFLVLVAMLVAWVVVHHGGGVLNQG
jgi:hypothetical protein